MPNHFDGQLRDLIAHLLQSSTESRYSIAVCISATCKSSRGVEFKCSIAPNKHRVQTTTFVTLTLPHSLPFGLNSPRAHKFLSWCLGSQVFTYILDDLFFEKSAQKMQFWILEAPKRVPAFCAFFFSV